MTHKKYTTQVLVIMMVALGVALILLVGSRATAQESSRKDEHWPQNSNLPRNDNWSPVNNRLHAGNRPQSANDVFDDGEWIEMGASSASGEGISNTNDDSWSPSVAFGSDGFPIVAWYQYTSSDSEIYVKRWNGSTWVEMGSGSASGGGISNNGDSSYYPSLAVGPDGTPIIAWQDYSGGPSSIYVKRWNGSSWVEMGSGSASGGGISNTTDSWSPSLAIGPDGIPIVAWDNYEYDGEDYEIYVRRWNGTSWVEMGSGSASGEGISKNEGWSEYASAAIGSDGVPYVAWEDDTSGIEQIYVKRWNGSAWVETGSGSASGGGVSNNSGWSRLPNMKVGIAGAPIVVWQDWWGSEYEDQDIYVRRWNGSSWAEMGSGSASGRGISESLYDAWVPELAISSDGVPVVVWSDYSPGYYEIYLRRWNGTAWIEMGENSATAGGVSNNGDGSFRPSVAVSPDGEPIVAWSDSTPGIVQTYVRIWEPADRLVYLPATLSGYYYFAPLPGSEEIEPNDKWHQANGALESSKVYNGTFSSVGDENDYFYFYQARVGSAAIKLSDIPEGQNYDLVLRDSDLEEIGYSGELNNDDELIIEDIWYGVYYIQVHNRGGGTDPGEYALQAVFAE